MDDNLNAPILNEEHSPFFILIPIIIIMINVIWLTIGSYTARAAKMEAKYPPIQFVVDFAFTSGLFYMLGFIHVQFISDNPLPFDAILFISAAGVLAVFAFLCLTQSVNTGKGALAMAITQT